MRLRLFQEIIFERWGVLIGVGCYTLRYIGRPPFGGVLPILPKFSNSTTMF